MKLGALTACLYDRPFETALEILTENKVETIEVGTGGYPGETHCSRRALLGKPSAQHKWKKAVDKAGLGVAAFAVHGNPFYPNQDIARGHNYELRETIELARQMGVPTVVCFSGLPGSEGSKIPVWSTNPWPPEQLENDTRQWEIAVPYWAEINELAEEAGVKIALEMHPNMLVHNPHTMLKLREATGANIGVNLDPSHLGWRGMEMQSVILALAGCIHHVHAKEYRVNDVWVRTNGFLSCTPFEDEANRPWQFCTVGRGAIGRDGWCEIINCLRIAGYDGVISIEHEDGLMSGLEGLAMAAKLLDEIIPRSQPSEMYWTKGAKAQEAA